MTLIVIQVHLRREVLVRTRSDTQTSCVFKNRSRIACDGHKTTTTRSGVEDGALQGGFLYEINRIYMNIQGPRKEHGQL